MEIVKFAAFAVVTALGCVALRKQNAEQAALLALAGCAGLGLTALAVVPPVLEFLRKLQALTGVNAAVFAPVLKTAGIGLLTQFSAAFCKDAGQQALGKAAEVGGTILAVYTLLPLAGAVVELLQGMAF